MITSGFWCGRRVLLTGHTGFKGSWLALMLARLEARVTGYALDPESGPQLYDLANVGRTLNDVRADIAERTMLARAVAAAKPEIIIHMAAQPLVLEGYRNPVDTYRTNVMGTVNLLEAARGAPGLRVVLIVTTDKCYADVERESGYGEDDRLGGDDPYSSSKACAELVTACYRKSFFADGNVAIASVRAGNVIGGGDFAADRIVPDAVRAMMAGTSLPVRHPHAVRPWQHVLDPLLAYLGIAERAFADAETYGRSWNIGPGQTAERNVAEVLAGFSSTWGPAFRWHCDTRRHPKESKTLRLDTSRAGTTLGWTPFFAFESMIEWTAAWYRAFATGGDIASLTMNQLDAFLGQCVRLTLPEGFVRKEGTALPAPASPAAAA